MAYTEVRTLNDINRGFIDEYVGGRGPSNTIAFNAADHDPSVAEVAAGRGELFADLAALTLQMELKPKDVEDVSSDIYGDLLVIGKKLRVAEDIVIGPSFTVDASSTIAVNGHKRKAGLSARFQPVADLAVETVDIGARAMDAEELLANVIDGSMTGLSVKARIGTNIIETNYDTLFEGVRAFFDARVSGPERIVPDIGELVTRRVRRDVDRNQKGPQPRAGQELFEQWVHTGIIGEVIQLAVRK